MFIADTQLFPVAALHTVGDDDDLALRHNLVQPAVDDAGDFHDRTQFFGELTNKNNASNRIPRYLIMLNMAARKPRNRSNPRAARCLPDQL
jgi:hypothetical protein